MHKRLFVTGTDTEVGKTVVSRGLLQTLATDGKHAVGYKPVAKSSQQTEEGPRNKDALVLQASSSLQLPYQAINPVTLLDDEISTSLQSFSYSTLSRGLHALDEQADYVVTEGTGGWRSLMSDRRPLSDWVVQEQMPVVLVVGIKLGCISHALLTAQAILNDGLPLLGWVANRINPGLAHYAEIINVLQDKIPAPLLGELPYLPRAETRDLSRYFDLSPLNL
ncbi:dethiobiotin synthase [Erwinia sp. JUb26]|uniref:dethiobiotin synthase n=1 Tax=Erwinia sp. JUb26 TaxID=2485126 RepID=UPI000F498CA6|nr:dethiobiotin synthase [Erwinia sp. JUb26]ROR15273.1 dethiobiotin synthetase [Erwinia sp. JUb26]